MPLDQASGLPVGRLVVRVISAANPSINTCVVSTTSIGPVNNPAFPGSLANFVTNLGCLPGITGITERCLTFRVPPGLGSNYIVRVEVDDTAPNTPIPGAMVYNVTVQTTLSYAQPVILSETAVQWGGPSMLGSSGMMQVVLSGRHLGASSLDQPPYSDVAGLNVTIGGRPCTNVVRGAVDNNHMSSVSCILSDPPLSSAISVTYGRIMTNVTAPTSVRELLLSNCGIIDGYLLADCVPSAPARTTTAVHVCIRILQQSWWGLYGVPKWCLLPWVRHSVVLVCLLFH
jgi:hypothetical protein